MAETKNFIGIIKASLDGGPTKRYAVTELLDSNLVWDNTNKRLGIGQTTPTSALHISGDGSARRNIQIQQTTADKTWAINVFETTASEGAGNFGINLVGSGHAILFKGIGSINLPSIPDYANNAAAVAGGLAAGDIYRTGGDPDTLCVVH